MLLIALIPIVQQLNIIVLQTVKKRSIKSKQVQKNIDNHLQLQLPHFLLMIQAVAQVVIIVNPIIDVSIYLLFYHRLELLCIIFPIPTSLTTPSPPTLPPFFFLLNSSLFCKYNNHNNHNSNSNIFMTPCFFITSYPSVRIDRVFGPCQISKKKKKGFTRIFGFTIFYLKNVASIEITIHMP